MAQTAPGSSLPNFPASLPLNLGDCLDMPSRMGKFGWTEGDLTIPYVLRKEVGGALVKYCFVQALQSQIITNFKEEFDLLSGYQGNISVPSFIPTQAEILLMNKFNEDSDYIFRSHTFNNEDPMITLLDAMKLVEIIKEMKGQQNTSHSTQGPSQLLAPPSLGIFLVQPSFAPTPPPNSAVNSSPFRKYMAARAGSGIAGSPASHQQQTPPSSRIPGASKTVPETSLLGLSTTGAILHCSRVTRKVRTSQPLRRPALPFVVATASFMGGVRRSLLPSLTSVPAPSTIDGSQVSKPTEITEERKSKRSPSDVEESSAKRPRS